MIIFTMNPSLKKINFGGGGGEGGLEKVIFHKESKFKKKNWRGSGVGGAG